MAPVAPGTQYVWGTQKMADLQPEGSERESGRKWLLSQVLEDGREDLGR